MLVTLGLWLLLAPLTLLAVAVLVYAPKTTRDDRGSVLQPWHRAAHGRHRKGAMARLATRISRSASSQPSTSEPMDTEWVVDSGGAGWWSGADAPTPRAGP